MVFAIFWINIPPLQNRCVRIRQVLRILRGKGPPLLLGRQVDWESKGAPHVLPQRILTWN